MKLFKNKFLTINFDENLSLIDFRWNKKTEDATDSDFKNWNNNIAEQIKKHKPSFVLSDNTNYLFPIIPILQEWSVENVFIPMTKAGVTKLAMILSPEIIAQMSLEQFSREAKMANCDFETKYFIKEKEARAWLFK